MKGKILEMIFLTDGGAPDKIQHPLVIKTLEQTRNRENILQHNKSHMKTQSEQQALG